MSWSDVTPRVLISYFVLLILTRIMGKKQISQLTFFNYVTGITIGSITANLSINSNVEISKGVYSLVLWAALTLIIDIVTLKSNKARVLLDGEPTILIKDGEIIEGALERTRITMHDLCLMLRSSSAFEINEVDYAILETNGKLTVLKKSEYKQTTNKDLNVVVSNNKNLPTNIIVNYKAVEENLDELNLNLDWLTQQISIQGYKNIEDIFYAELGSNGQLYIIPNQRSKVI